MYYILPFALLGESRYNRKYRAKRGGSGALYSQSAIVRLNSYPRRVLLWSALVEWC